MSYERFNGQRIFPMTRVHFSWASFFESPLKKKTIKLPLSFPSSRKSISLKLEEKFILNKKIWINTSNLVTGISCYNYFNPCQNMETNVKLLIEPKETLNFLSKTQKHIERIIVKTPCRLGSEARTPSSFSNHKTHISGGFFPLESYKISLGVSDEKSLGSLEHLDSPDGKGESSSRIIYVKSPQTIKSRGLSNRSGPRPSFGIEAEEVKKILLCF